MKDLTIAEVLALKDLEFKKVVVEEWKGNVYIKILSAEERSELEDLFRSGVKKTGSFRKEMLKRTWVNASGELEIKDDSTAAQLMKKNSNAIETIFEEACALNGFREKDVETLKKR